MKPAEDDGPGAYVRRVAQDTQRYAEELMGENHRLRLRVTTLESEEQRLGEKLRATDDVLRHNDALRTRVLALEGDKLGLQQRLVEVCGTLDRHLQDQEQLKDSVRRVQAESERFAEQYRDLESQNSNLANLYVASYRLHATLDRVEILAIIQEIVTNLIGSEEIGIFEKDGSSLQLLASTGIDPVSYRRVALSSGILGHCASGGRTFVSGDGDDPAERTPQEADLSACVPLILDGRVSGVIALFRLLPQKRQIEALDRELFDLLATHAATALYCAALHTRRAAVAS
jgi:putative methionine-R-sulfoxide reductase with GAF domain